MKSQKIVPFITLSLLINLTAMTIVPATIAAKNSNALTSSASKDSHVAVNEFQPTVSEERVGDKTFAVGTILVKAKPEKIWEILTNYANQPELFSTVKKCQVVEDKGAKKLVRQIVCPKGSPMHFDYIVEIDEVAPKLMEWHRKSGALKDVSGSWKLEPDASKHNTILTYSIYIDGGTFLPAWLLRGQSKNQLPDVLNSIKGAAERASASSATTGSGAS